MTTISQFLIRTYPTIQFLIRRWKSQEFNLQWRIRNHFTNYWLSYREGSSGVGGWCRADWREVSVTPNVDMTHVHWVNSMWSFGKSKEITECHAHPLLTSRTLMVFIRWIKTDSRTYPYPPPTPPLNEFCGRLDGGCFDGKSYGNGGFIR